MFFFPASAVTVCPLTRVLFLATPDPNIVIIPQAWISGIWGPQLSLQDPWLMCFLSPPVHFAPWANMHNFLSVWVCESYSLKELPNPHPVVKKIHLNLVLCGPGRPRQLFWVKLFFKSLQRTSLCFNILCKLVVLDIVEDYMKRFQQITFP